MAKYPFLKTVLIAPLDWGLGHASRCIPIIKHLQKRGCKVIVASDGEQLNLLQKEFPGLEFIMLKGYNVQYSKYKRWLGVKILWQIPKILQMIRWEHNYLHAIIDEFDIDFVISDNRYGLYNDKIPCVFITHQLVVKAPSFWLQNFIQKINYRFISRFTECWIPDFERTKNIAGLLSHPAALPKGINKYIGPLSRFSKVEKNENFYKYLFILSGPEPQRSILEEKIRFIAPKLAGKILIARGKPTEPEFSAKSTSVNIKNHLSTDEMQKAFLQSEYIISRSGYTTVMELLSLGKKSILIPTPGQTEQEYLANHLMQQQWCYTCNQDDDLLFHIQQAEKFDYIIPELDVPIYEKIIDDFLVKLSLENPC